MCFDGEEKWWKFDVVGVDGVVDKISFLFVVVGGGVIW